MQAAKTISKNGLFQLAALHPSSQSLSLVRKSPDTLELLFERRYESNFVCPTKVLSQMRLSEAIPYKTCAKSSSTTKNTTEQTSMRTKWFNISRFKVFRRMNLLLGEKLNTLLHRVLQGAPPEGGDGFTSLFLVLKTLHSKRQKQPFLP